MTFWSYPITRSYCIYRIHIIGSWKHMVQRSFLWCKSYQITVNASYFLNSISILISIVHSWSKEIDGTRSRMSFLLVGLTHNRFKKLSLHVKVWFLTKFIWKDEFYINSIILSASLLRIHTNNYYDPNSRVNGAYQPNPSQVKPR